MECEWCVYRDKGYPEICKYCRYNETTKPRQDLERIDIFELARGLHSKEVQEGVQAIKGKIPELSNCPKCERYSLFFDSIHNQFECLNRGCVLFGKPIVNHSELFVQIVIKILRVSFP